MSVRTANHGCCAVEACLACGSRGLVPVLDLGQQPLANNLPVTMSADPEPVFPLGIQLCPRCRLVQLTHIVDPALMFESYVYVPSTSTTWLDHCEELADDVCRQGSLQPGDRVVEIGSNDGTLLRAFQRRGLDVLGIDPARNIAEQANAAGVPTLNRFFGEATARDVLREYGPAQAIVSTNVLAHVPEPVGLLHGVRTLLAPRGIYVNESPSLLKLVEHNEFDTIYHEHVSYFSLHALYSLCGRAWLQVIAAVPQPVHGGSLRLFARPETAEVGELSSELWTLLAAEREAGITELVGLQRFAQRTLRLREQLCGLMRQLLADGRCIAAYGATAKGNTLLNYCGLTGAEIQYVVDRNPLKQGRLTPGSHLPIVPVEHLAAAPPDVLLLLAWNLADEIRQQLSWFAERGGQFLLPVPEPCLV